MHPQQALSPQSAGYSSVGSATLGSINTPTPATPLDSSLSATFQACGELTVSVRLLIERLGPVLQPELPQTAAQGSNRELREVLPMCSQTVTQLHNLRGQIEGLAAQLDQTRGRLDA